MAKVWRYPIILPTTGATSGFFPVKPPWGASYVAVLNNTAASLYVTEGQTAVQPPDALLFGAGVALSAPLDNESNTITVFWSAATAPGPTNNQAVILLSDQPIPLQAGVNSSGGVASNVNVTNTISASLTGTPNVTLAAGNNLVGNVQLNDGTGKSPYMSGSTGDAETSATTLYTIARMVGFNGSTWDRLRVDSQKNLLVGLRNSSGAEPLINNFSSGNDGAGISDVGLMVQSHMTAFNGASWDRLRVDANKNLQVSLRDHIGNEPGVNNGSGDGYSASIYGIDTISYLYGYNGTTYDRLRTDANKNLQVSLRGSNGQEPLVATQYGGDGWLISDSTLSVTARIGAYNNVTGKVDRVRMDTVGNLNVTSNGMTTTPSTAQVTVGTTAVQLKVGASDLTNRKSITIKNKGSVSVFIGGSGVTTTTGYEVEAGTSISFDQQPGATAPIYAISGTASQTVQVMEVA